MIVDVDETTGATATWHYGLIARWWFESDDETVVFIARKAKAGRAAGGRVSRDDGSLLMGARGLVGRSWTVVRQSASP